MGNFKVKVNTLDESKEIQNILESIGFRKLEAWSESGSVGGFIWTDSDMTYCDNRIEYFDESPRKELTLPELRAMVRPMKEYLDKQEDGTYKLITASSGCADRDWIEIPEGAEIAIQFKNNHNEHGIIFYKDGGKACIGENDNSWQRDSEWTMDQLLNENYHDGGIDLSHWIIWQRTPSLNDQYAEIEQVRQHKKHEHNSSAWDIQIGGDHYKQFKIQPMQFALENKLDAAQQNVIKYVMRHSFKNGKQDLEKAKHYIDLMIEFYYGDNNNG